MSLYLAESLKAEWNTLACWRGIKRPYTAEEVIRLRGSLQVQHTLATMGACRFRHLLDDKDYVHALGALTGNQAVQIAKAGLEAIYLSGWQVAADANNAGQMYPDQSLYPADSVPTVVRNINNALQRADQIEWAENSFKFNDYFLPIIADAEAGFGGVLNAFELTKALIEAGAAAVHFEDQLSSAKKCGHMGGKVLVPTQEGIDKLVAARLAADVENVPTVIIARTDALGAKLLTSDIDDRDKEFTTGERTKEGFYIAQPGMAVAVSRALAYAPYVEMLWCETSTPNLEDAKIFAEAVRYKYPDQMLAYNCSPSFNWTKHLDKETIAKFQRELAAMGYKFQFITLAGFHALNYSMFDLADKYREGDMSAFVELQEKEFASEDRGYTATRHQREVGASYFDRVTETITGGSSTTSLAGSTEEDQFYDGKTE